MVLGAAVWSGGRPSAAMRRRVERAADLFHSGAAPRLLVTGGLGRHPPAEAEVMARIAEGLRVPRAVILKEGRARTTWESARYCYSILRELGSGRVLLVTDDWHLPRALLAFRRHGIAADGEGAGGGPGEVGTFRWIGYALREKAGMIWYALRKRTC